MAEYNGVHVRTYKVRGVRYVGLWWYIGQGSQRDTKGLGRKSEWTKAALDRARLKEERRLALQPGCIGSDRAPTLSAWFEQWKANKQLAAATLGMMDRTVKKMAEFENYGTNPMGLDRRIDKITRAHTIAWTAWLRESGMKEPTVCKYVRCASSLFGEQGGAVGLDLIPFNPFGRLRKNTDTPTKSHPDLSDGEVQRLIETCPDARWRALVALIAHAGVRRGEALAVEWSDIQWGKGRLLVSNLKTSKHGQIAKRECLMEPALETILLECYEQAEEGTRRVAPISTNNLNRQMLSLMARAGLSWSEPFHGLRRRRASTWKLVYPAYVVNLWLGHSEAVSRKSYLTVPEALYAGEGRTTLRKLVDRLSAEKLERAEKLLRRLESAQHRRNKRGEGAKSGVFE